MERIAPSVRLEAQIEKLLGDELAANGEKLAELGRLGARLVIQRAVEDEVTAFLGRARYERTPEAAGSRNGTRPKRVQTAEGEISVDMPQIRGTAAQFISRVFPDSRTVIRTRPLEALIIGGYVRGLSDRDIESLIQEAGLGQVSKSTASRICRELRGSTSDLRYVHADLTLRGLDRLRPRPVTRASRLGRALVARTTQEGGHFVFHGSLQHQPRSQPT